MGKKALHLLDSLVTMKAHAKGRSSARRLAGIVKRNNALQLAGFITMTLAFARSALNPADRPSRAIPTLLRLGHAPGRRGP